MRRNLLIVLFSFLASWAILTFWSIVLNLLMLPYQVYRVFSPNRKPGRPGGHLVSKWFRKAFENKKMKRFVGVGLTIIIMFSGLISTFVSADEPVASETLINTPEVEIVTKTTLEQPLKGVIGQGYHAFHRAIDILAPIGTPIMPIAKGIVKEASFGRLGWGNTVVIEHENGLTSRYAHLRDIRVIEGEMVNKGQEIGTIGMTGWTTGPHLHLEVYQDGRAINPKVVLPEFTDLLAQK